MTQTIGEYAGAEFLGDKIKKIILECFGDPAYHGHTHGKAKKAEYRAGKVPPEWLVRGFVFPVIGSQVDQAAENDGIYQRKAYVNACQY
jgi:hypothetical protein